MTNLAVEDVSEEDKIKAVLYQSTYNTMKWVYLLTTHFLS